MRRRGSVRSPRVTRKRRRAEEKAEQEAAVVCKVEDEAEESAMLTELEQLLGPGEAAAWLMKEEVYQPHGDASLTDLLQQLADYEDETSTSAGHSPHYVSEAGSTSAPPNMAARQKPAARSSDNKNALAARLNRLRKKEYVHGLEGQVTRLTEGNQRLERDRSELRERVRNLEEEVRYLRAVLANDSALAGLLGGLTKLGGVKFTTSLFLHREKKPREHDYALPGEEDAERAPPAGGGVCLHVDQGNVSVEFCPVCAGRAAASAAAAAAKM